jgi:hypothetical protein
MSARRPSASGSSGSSEVTSRPSHTPLFGKISAASFGAGGIGPAFGEGGIDGFKNGIEPLGQIGALRHPERDAGLPDLVLGARQALTHGGGRDQESRRDGGGIEAENGLQHQRCPDATLDRRVGAGEHQAQALIRNLRLGCQGGLQFLCHQPQMVRGALAAAPPPDSIDQLAPRHRHQPRLWARWDSVHRPIDQGGGEGIGQGVFCGRHIPRAGREKGDQLAVTPARHRFGGFARLLVTLSWHRNCSHALQIGRTSTAP